MLTYVRNSFGNDGDVTTLAEVKDFRDSLNPPAPLPDASPERPDEESSRAPHRRANRSRTERSEPAMRFYWDRWRTGAAAC